MRVVVHQFAEHVDGDTGVGVPLGVRMPVGIRDEGDLSNSVPSPRSSGPIESPRSRCRPVEVVLGDRTGPVGVEPPGGQQLQPGGRRVREPLADGGFCAGDQRGGVLADRQAAGAAGEAWSCRRPAPGCRQRRGPGSPRSSVQTSAGGGRCRSSARPRRGSPGRKLTSSSSREAAAELPHDLIGDVPARARPGRPWPGHRRRIRVKSSGHAGGRAVARVRPRERMPFSTRPASWQVLTRQ